jgi:hypothetical protein
VNWVESLVRTHTGEAFSDLDSIFSSPRQKRKLEKYLRRHTLDQVTTNELIEIGRRIVVQDDPYLSQIKLIALGQFSEADHELINRRIQFAIVDQGLIEAFTELGLLKDRDLRDNFRGLIKAHWKQFEFMFQTVQALVSGVQLLATGHGQATLLPHWRFVTYRALPPELQLELQTKPLSESEADVAKYLGWKTRVDVINGLVTTSLGRIFLVITALTFLNRHLGHYGWSYDDLINQIFKREFLEQQVFEAEVEQAHRVGAQVDEVALKKSLHKINIKTLRELAHGAS